MSPKQQVSPWQSILAGGAAGGTESLLTYPTEYLKTRQQLPTPNAGRQSLISLLTSTIRQHGLRTLYTGSGVFCASNATKSAIRFFAFDSARKSMPTDTAGNVTPLGNMGAGLVAGVAEAVLVVTPGETIKTKMIDDRAGVRQYRSTGHGIVSIVSREGLGGLYRGVVPVTLKQGANAMVRFTSYNFILGQLDGLVGGEGQGLRQSLNTVLAGALAGVVTVYATMPLVTIKTRLQAVDARQRYAGSVDCLRSVVASEGVAALWRGTTPRLVRLSVSGALSFSIYESVLQWSSKYTVPERHQVA
ncbi:mitochondrial carrier [Aspergillus steynii IBT 23096]|uniref:Mitochondrial carrier n=1 Tax=Aspergillus steynii IBT 23096 TaxID=1392250 RepID=A0A2I2GAZ9_9EURO|nr:mitochondrial carrier [Aspergillus steynii IBT 23096]PLB50046.1 mitochondrial carrier [Aspergillus steynii IBT 23096]